MNKIELRKLIMDIGYLFNKHTDNKDIDMSALMDELNKMDSYRPLQKALKEQKEYHKVNIEFKEPDIE